MIFPFNECISICGNGGEILSQTVQSPAWIREKKRTTKTDNLFPNHFIIQDPGLVIVNAITTVIVLAKRDERATEKMMPNAVCRVRQVNIFGSPINSKGQRKQNRREIRKM